MKNDNKAVLSVEERVKAMMHARLAEDPLARISISEMCRLAGVNRAGLYAHHRTLVDEIRKNHMLPKKKKDSVIAHKKTTPLFHTQKVEALLYLCLELQLEVRSLKALLPDAPKRKINSTKTKGGV